MHPAISKERWQAMRALYEDDERTHQLIATAAGLHAVTVQKRSADEGWVKPLPVKERLAAARANILRQVRARRAAAGAPGPGEEGGAAASALAANLGETLDERLRRLGDFLTRQLEEVVATAEASGGPLDKARIDGLASMLKMIERSEALTPERAASQAENDAELADVLRRIDERIVELARYFAEQMGANRADGGTGTAG